MKTILIVAVVISSLSAFAGRNRQSVTTDSSLNDLITMCERLERNPQIKPFSAEVTCRGHKTFWEIDNTYSQDLTTDLVIRAEVTMKGDRYRVDEYTRSMSSTPGAAECNIYREMRVDYLPVTIKLNDCAELRDLQSEGRDVFCARHLADAPFDNENGLATGRTRDTCR